MAEHRVFTDPAFKDGQKALDEFIDDYGIQGLLNDSEKSGFIRGFHYAKTGE